MAKPTFFLPPRCPEPNPSERSERPGMHTYYLSCDVRGLSIYLPHAVKHTQNGFRAAILAPQGLVFEPPSIVLLGLQDGDVFEHASRWAKTNPIDEIHVEAVAAKRTITLKEQERAQKRFQNAVSTVEGVEQARLEAEAELEAATAELIQCQGVQEVCIDGIYYDPAYSRERVYLKRRDPRFYPQETDTTPKRKRGSKRKRAA